MDNVNLTDIFNEVSNIVKEESNKENNRPFFSIIIPCYNSKVERIMELLSSICKAISQEYYNKLEVIVSDGGSDNKEYLKEVEKFKSESGINTKIVYMPDKNEEGIELIHCPGNTREYGVREATGEWITFIDHDDEFTEDALNKIMNTINQYGEKYFICGNILQYNPYKNVVKQEIIHATNWMHGKFYNLDNFWNAFDFHFKTNLFSNEDICISSKVHCVWGRLNKDKYSRDIGVPTLWVEDFVYVWKCWKDSTSNILYGNQDYMERFFKGYMEATMEVYIKDYNDLVKANALTDFDINFNMMMRADCIIHIYFYLQKFKFIHYNEYDLEYEFIAKKYIREFYDTFGMDADSLYDFIDNYYSIKCKWYNDVRVSAKEGVGYFIEGETFYDFISK